MIEMNMASEKINWPRPSSNWSPSWNNDRSSFPNVHVFGVSLNPPVNVLETLARILASPELDRAASFRFEHDRNRFIAGRGLLRVILGHYLNANPAKLEFVYGGQGKPMLGGAFATTGLHFNFAHSEGLGLLAISPVGAVGVDVECIRPLNDVDRLVNRFFSPREIAAFQKVPVYERSLAFFRLWTRKEAFLKATGEGIAHSLDQVEVSFLSDESAELLHLPRHLGQVANWHSHDLAPASGFVAALVAPIETACPICWSWVTECGLPAAS
jgi:4'-phosphopantetheinyl transferase